MFTSVSIDVCVCIIVFVWSFRACFSIRGVKMRLAVDSGSLLLCVEMYSKKRRWNCATVYSALTPHTAHPPHETPTVSITSALTFKTQHCLNSCQGQGGLFEPPVDSFSIVRLHSYLLLNSVSGDSTTSGQRQV